MRTEYLRQQCGAPAYGFGPSRPHAVVSDSMAPPSFYPPYQHQYPHYGPTQEPLLHVCFNGPSDSMVFLTKSFEKERVYLNMK